MDEREAIPRREAVTGLGFLAVLMVALVATIVARIVRSAPEVLDELAAPTTRASQDMPATVDAQLQDAWDQPAADAASNDALAVDQLPAATPTPTAEAETTNIPTASVTPEIVQPLETSPEPLPTRPVFIAPASR